jgi:uncharacterized protein YgbK (DUF1537 family)
MNCAARGIEPADNVQGGITSSDAATKGLRMRKADIVGQAAAGVPLWRCSEPTSKWPGIRKLAK